MATIKFEGIAPDNDSSAVPDGYKAFDWNNFYAIDDDVWPNSGYHEVIVSGEAAAYNGGGTPATFKSLGHDFTLESGYFAGAWNDDLNVKVVAFDDGDAVGVKEFTVDQEKTFVTFGHNFESIDKVRIVTSGGTDADPTDGNGPGTNLAMDNLVVDWL